MFKTRQEIQNSYITEQEARDYERKRFSHPFWQMAHEKEVAFINNFFKKIRPKKILEIAIGPARVAKDLKYFKEGIGIDNSEAMLKVAKIIIAKRFPANDRKKWTLIKADAFDLPFEENSFDVVLSFRFIRHFLIEDRTKILRQAFRVLNPGGYLIFEALNKNMGEYAKKKAGIGQKTVLDKAIYDQLWDEEELKKELTNLEFKQIEPFPYLKSLNNLWGIYKIAAASRLLGLGFIFKWLFRLLDGFWSGEPYQWEVICQKPKINI